MICGRGCRRFLGAGFPGGSPAEVGGSLFRESLVGEGLSVKT